MNTKTIIILFITLLIVSLLAALPYIQEKTGMTNRTQQHSEISFQTFTTDVINTVRIKKGDTEFTLAKEIDGWNVASFSAYQTYIDAFFSALKESTSGILVSKNEINSSEFGVASHSGMFVTLTGTSNSSTFIIGKDGPETGTFYAKKEGSNNVYLIKSPLKDAIKTTVDDWRNKTVIQSIEGNIGSIEVSGVEGFIIKKNDKKWEITAQEKTRELKETEVSTLFTRLFPLEGREFLNEEEQKQFAISTVNKISIKDADQKLMTEVSFLEKEGDYWMKKSETKDILKVSGYKLKEFFAMYSS